MSRGGARQGRLGRPAGSGRAPDEGFTLVEVIAAMTVFIIVSTGAIAVLVGALRIVRENADRAVASSIARSYVEDLRTLGADALTPGLTTTTETVGGVTYSVETSAQWVALDQTGSACDVSVDPDTVAFMRVHVDVTGGQLSGPQSIDAVIPRLDDAPPTTTGSASIKVVDDQGAGVSGATVTLTNVSAAGAPAAYTTGVDGCLLVTGLAAANGWKIDVQKSGYVAPTPGGTSLTTNVAVGINSAVSFSYAPQATVILALEDDSYPIPKEIPLSFVTDPLGRAPSTPLTYPLRVEGLYPGTYQAWPGRCSDAGAGLQSTVIAAAGSTTRVPLAGKQVDIVAPPGARVTMTHTSFTTGGSCPGGGLPNYTVGTVDDSMVLRVTVPTGGWSFAATTDDSTFTPIPVEFTATSRSPCSVTWDTGLATKARKAAERLIARADALAKDTEDKKVTMAIVEQAGRDLALDLSPGPGGNEVTVKVPLGAATGSIIVRVDADGKATAADEVTEIIGSPPVPFASTYAQTCRVTP